MKHSKILKLFSLIMILIVCVCPLLVGCGGDPNDPIGNISRQVETSFGGRSAYVFEDINGKDVTVETFFVNQHEGFVNNPNIGQAVMLNDAIRYKQAHPEEDVYATITSFHFSVVTSVCLDETSPNYLKTKALYDCEYDDEGYVRISYLAVKAAMCGINTIVIGQIDAAGVKISEDKWKGDYSFEKYYKDYLDQPTEIEGKKVSDFMTFRVAEWTSYGDKSATDMMHLKSCTVSNYRDYKGVDHGSAIWLGSINLDGIDYLGCNGNNNVQTATIISEHDELRNVLYNYTKLMAQYCDQEGIYEFRHLVNMLNKKQIDFIEAGNEGKILNDEQIVYLGTKNDPVFELYFTPLADTVNEWDTKYNVYSKYFEKLLPENTNNQPITIAWASAKFKEDSAFSNSLSNVLARAFNENKNKGNKLFLSLPYYDSDAEDKGESTRFDYTLFDNLTVGKDIGFKRYGANQGIHSKDFQISYVENGKRQYVSVFNSLNFHQGSAYYQTNSFLVIKESKAVGNNIYVDFGKMISCGAITEADRV